MQKLFFLAAGGAVGAILRYALASLVQRAAGESFPAGTLTVNVLGCLALGVLAAVFAEHLGEREDLRLFVFAGCLGSFTTFSAFGWETFQLLEQGELGRAAANVVANVVLGLACVWFGYRVIGS